MTCVIRCVHDDGLVWLCFHVWMTGSESKQREMLDISIWSWSSSEPQIINYITLIHAIDLPERHNIVDHQTHLAFQRSSSNLMERLRGPAQTVSSLLKLCLERDRSLLGNERVAENGEMRIVSKTNNIPIYNGRPYNWEQLYLSGSNIRSKTLLTSLPFNQKIVYNCVLQGLIA
jgi:hypothetical protein